MTLKRRSSLREGAERREAFRAYARNETAEHLTVSGANRHARIQNYRTRHIAHLRYSDLG